MIVSLFLLGKRITLYAHFTSGLAISILLIGSLGLFGRIVHLPFGFIRPVFALIGLFALLALIPHSRLERQLYKPKRFSPTTFALLFCMFVLSTLINLQSRLGGDDFSYLAYLTNWQYAQPLSFRPIFFESGDVDAIRFWLGMFPMTLAFLAEISNLHGLLLLGVYLESYLVTIAIIVVYSVYEDFLEKESLTIAAVLLHFTFFVLLQGGRQLGSTFFLRISEDKAFAAFILAPIFFLAIRHFLESFTLRNGIFLLLIGLSLTLTHPVILAYSLFIAGLYISLVTVTERNFNKLGVSMALLIIIVLPTIFQRFIDGPLTTRYAVNLQLALDAYGTGETRFSYIEGTPFYGFDLQRVKILPAEPEQQNLLQVFFSWSYLWLLVLGFLWSLFNLRKNKIAPFIASTSALVLLCGIPYTGWLLGYFVSAGMLWRSPWLLPIGLIGVVLFTNLVQFVSHKITTNFQSKITSERTILGLISLVCIVLILYVSAQKYNAMLPAIRGQNSYKNDLEHLAGLGNYLENNIEQPSVFVAPLGLMNYLPGLSSKSKVVLFRSPQFTPEPVDTKKIELILSKNASIPIKERINILKRYQIRYILTRNPSVRDYYARYTEFFKIQEFNRFWIIELEDSGS